MGLHKSQHPKLRNSHYAPYQWENRNYGPTQQWVTNDSDGPRLPQKGIQKIKQVVRNFLFYVRTADPTMQVTLGSRAAAHTQVTSQTADGVVQFLEYFVMHPNAVIRYHGSNMIPRGHIYASYLSKYKTRISSGGKFYTGSRDYNNTQNTNGKVLTVSIIMKHVMSAAAEAEVAVLFHNCQESEALWVTL